MIKSKKVYGKDRQTRIFVFSLLLLIIFMLLEVLNIWYKWMPRISFIAIGCMAITMIQLLCGIEYILTSKRRKKRI